MRRAYIVAEIGCNHNGDASLAKEMVLRASECGVDAVKFQTFKADALISRHAPKAEYQKETTGEEDSQLEMTRALELCFDDFLRLRDYAKSLGLGVFSTAFDRDSAELLHKSGQKVWKIPSGEITNLPLLEQVGSYGSEDGSSIILSSGMATLREIESCLNVLYDAGAKPEKVTLLHCNTEYPTPDKDVNISAMQALKRAFPNVSIGFSDHSVGAVAGVGAVALGATFIEKHFTLDKNLPGPDHKASATPEELRALVEGIRRIEVMLGNGEKLVTASELPNKIVARKSIVASKPIAKGDIFSETNCTCKRPGNGISPMDWYEIIGLEASRDFEEDDLIEHPGFKKQGII